MRIRHLLLVIPALAALLAMPATLLAQAGASPETLQGAGRPADVKAGTYEADPAHTQVMFSVSHMGISPFAGAFSEAKGTLVLDPAKLASTRLSVTIPIASVTTTNARLTGELKSADWFDAAKYPTATFTATSVAASANGGARIAGNLSLHGVSRPVTIDARFFGTARNPMTKKESVGFLARAVIKRSEFGIGKYVPMVSDETVLIINAAFEMR